VTAVFAGNGALFGSLFGRLPEIQDRLGLSEGELGLALLGGPVGLIAAVAIVGAAVVRFGSRRLSALGGLAYAAGIVLPALASSGWALAGTLVLLGAASGTLDVAMNTQGVTVEKRYPRRIFASLHAGFSFGLLGGAASAGLVAAAGVPLTAHLLGVAAVVAAVIGAGVSQFLTDADPDADAAAGTRAAFARPSRALLALGAIAFAVLLAEGALNDWSAIYLSDVHDTGPGTAAAGLAVFSLAMAAGRLTGDRLAERLGSGALARGGLLLGAAGFAVAALAPGPATAIGAFVALGLGLASVYPLVMRAAATRADVPAGAAIAAVTTTGYVGFLAGPPLVGLVAHATSLRVSLLVVGALVVVAATLTRPMGATRPPVAAAAPRPREVSRV
jgi:MFS family permease